MTDLPVEVKQFIDRQIESLAQLETLLLLRQAPERTMTAAEIAKAMYVPPESSLAVLKDLERRGMVKPMAAADPRYLYQPADEATAKIIDALAQLYDERRVAVISQIYSKPTSKVQTFADAFRLGKET